MYIHEANVSIDISEKTIKEAIDTWFDGIMSRALDDWLEERVTVHTWYEADVGMKDELKGIFRAKAESLDMTSIAKSAIAGFTQELIDAEVERKIGEALSKESFRVENKFKAMENQLNRLINENNNLSYRLSQL